jgi:hypothetical protein
MHRCGYVRVPPTHPTHGKGYDDIEVGVHGGLTFAQMEPCTEHEDGQGWWFGFDCAHCDDAMYDPSPDLAALSEKGRAEWIVVDRIHRQTYTEVYGTAFVERDHYWTQAEVERECEQLAEQLDGISH